MPTGETISLVGNGRRCLRAFSSVCQTFVSFLEIQFEGLFTSDTFVA